MNQFCGKRYCFGMTERNVRGLASWGGMRLVETGVLSTIATTLLAFATSNFVSVGPCAGPTDTTVRTRIAALVLSVSVLASGSFAVLCFYRFERIRRVMGAIVGSPFVLWNLLLCWRVGAMGLMSGLLGM